MVLSIEQTCEILGCKRSKVFQLLAKGILLRAPRYGKELRIYRASVEEALMPKTKARRRRFNLPEPFTAADIHI